MVTNTLLSLHPSALQHTHTYMPMVWVFTVCMWGWCLCVDVLIFVTHSTGVPLGHCRCSQSPTVSGFWTDTPGGGTHSHCSGCVKWKLGLISFHNCTNTKGETTDTATCSDDELVLERNNNYTADCSEKIVSTKFLSQHSYKFKFKFKIQIHYLSAPYNPLVRSVS